MGGRVDLGIKKLIPKLDLLPIIKNIFILKWTFTTEKVKLQFIHEKKIFNK